MLNYYPPRYLFRRHEILRRLERGRCFLEIGGGSLLLAQELLAFFDAGIVLEPAQEARKKWADLPEPLKVRLRLEGRPLEEFTAGMAFDCVVACEVLEHVDDDLAMVRQMFSLLRPQGRLVISVPARRHFWSVHDQLVGHLRRYEKEELLHLFNQAGFMKIQVISYGFPFVNLLRWPRILLAQIGRAKKMAWDQQRRTRESGINQVAGFHSWLGLLVNPITIWPLCRMATLFNGYFWSDGCIVVAIRPSGEKRG
ncbi:MAG: class I SAM-dependent methyltransferase [Magnetococcus sp. THC-1_WYH]